jgi:hypothetical protein
MYSIFFLKWIFREEIPIKILNITGVLICDYNSIELRRKLVNFVKDYYQIYKEIIQKPYHANGVVRMLDIEPVIDIFY